MRGSRSSFIAQGRGLGSSQPSAVAAIARVEVLVHRSREGPWVLPAVGGPHMAGAENDHTKKSFWTDSIHDRKPMISCWARADKGGSLFGLVSVARAPRHSSGAPPLRVSEPGGAAPQAAPPGERRPRALTRSGGRIFAGGALYAPLCTPLYAPPSTVWAFGAGGGPPPFEAVLRLRIADSGHLGFLS